MTQSCPVHTWLSLQSQRGDTSTVPEGPNTSTCLWELRGDQSFWSTASHPATSQQ